MTVPFALVGSCLMLVALPLFSMVAAQPAPGPPAFAALCSSCHGDEAGGTARGPGLALNPRVAVQSNEQLRDFLRRGNPGAGMPGFPDVSADDLTTPPTVTTTATTTSPAGTYPITVSGAASPNYTIAYVNGTLTITGGGGGGGGGGGPVANDNNYATTKGTSLLITAPGVLGNDSGGGIAQIFAALTPDRVRTLTLTNCDTHDNWPPEAFKPFVDMVAGGGLRVAESELPGVEGKRPAVLVRQLAEAHHRRAFKALARDLIEAEDAALARAL